VREIKNLFHTKGFDTVELVALNEGMKVLGIVTDMVTRFGYADVAKIRTGMVSNPNASSRPVKLEVVLEKSEDFEEKYQQFSETVNLRRERDNNGEG